jgi:hypothetical protein
MPATMREELRKAAQKRDRSEGQELLARLQGSFDRDRKSSRDIKLQALCFLIAETAERIGRNWRSNPFYFEAFKLTVAKLLDALRPPGKIGFPLTRTPREKQGLLYRVHKNPKAYSEYVFANIMEALNRNPGIRRDCARGSGNNRKVGCSVFWNDKRKTPSSRTARRQSQIKNPGLLNPGLEQSDCALGAGSEAVTVTDTVSVKLKLGPGLQHTT